MANVLIELFKVVAKALNIHLNIITSDGSQPVGRGIGPALEAKDVLAVLQSDVNAPKDLRERALTLAGMILEFSPDVKLGDGKSLATQILDKGKAWKKFQVICDAQGGLRPPPTAKFTQTILSPQRGRVVEINNRQIARLAKLAGAPYDKAAGVLLHTPLDSLVEKEESLFTVHAETKGSLNYALSLLDQIPEIIQVEAYE